MRGGVRWGSIRVERPRPPGRGPIKSELDALRIDGSARGGVLLAIADTLGLPIRFIGVGEQLEDLGVFNAADFVDALLQPQDKARERGSEPHRDRNEGTA